MKERPALASCSIFWLALAGAVTYGLFQLGLPLLPAAVAAFMLFYLINGALAYRFLLYVAWRIAFEKSAPKMPPDVA